MAAYDLTLVFCSEAQVFNAGGYRWTDDDTPTDVDVYEFAQQAAGDISMVTLGAGSRLDPPASGISDVGLRNIVVRANAVGAAYYAWTVMAKAGDEDALDTRNQYREQWIRYIGGTAANGKEVQGTIPTAVATTASTFLGRNDETGGHVKFPSSGTAKTLDRPFTDADVD